MAAAAGTGHPNVIERRGSLRPSAVFLKVEDAARKQALDCQKPNYRIAIDARTLSAFS